MSKMPIDLPDRQAAVNPAYSYLVQAPAGSGKTELLTDRFLALLPLVQRPEEILAITFTRKAAAEMRDRILKKLQRGMDSNEPTLDYEKQAWHLARKALERDQEQGWNLLKYPSRLRVQTIDSFCQTLVRLTPSLSGAGSSLNPTDFAAVLYQEAAQRTLEQIDQSEAVQTLVAHLDLNLPKTEELLVEMLKSRDQWGFIVEDESAALAQMVQTLHRIVEDQLAHAKQLMPLGWEQDLIGALREAAAHFVQDDPSHPLACILDWDGQSLAPTFDEVERWVVVANFLLTDKGTMRKSVSITNGIEKTSPHKPALVAWLKRHEPDLTLVETLNKVRTLPLALIEPANMQTFKAFFTCLQMSLANLQAVFTEQTQVDFIEIAQRASKALGNSDNPSDLLLKLDLSLKHILMDEFQDTSYSQMQLLEKIVSGWSQGDGRTLFLVGDPMQSIYRFRKAEVGLFLKVSEQKKVADVDIHCLHLQENFRSDKGVVDWVNQVFARIFPAQNDMALGGISYSPSHPFNDLGPRPAIQLYPFHYDAEEDKQAKAKVELEAEKAIIHLVKNALANHPDSEHPVVILVRGRTHLGQIASLLQANNIPLKAVDIVALQNTPEVEDLVQLIRALSHEGDRLAWMALLRSPFCGLDLKSLTSLFRSNFKELVPRVLRSQCKLKEELRNSQANTQASEQASIQTEELSDLIGAEPAQRLRHFCSIVLQRPYHQSDLSFPSFVENIWRQLGGFDVYSSPAEHENMQSVLTLLDKLAPYGNIDANEFQEQLQGLYAAPASQGPGVEIMTMHKAKGLEFEEVIIYGLHRQPPNAKHALIEVEQLDGELLMGTVAHAASKAEDAVSKLIRQRNAEREKYELARLLYVAATRARANLHIVYLVSAKELDKGSVDSRCMLSHLYPYIQEDMCYPAEHLGDLATTVTEPAGAANQWQTGYNNSQLSRLSAESLALLQPTLVEQWRGAISAPVWQFEDKRQAAIGTVVHAWLEQISIDRMENWSLDRIQEARAIISQQLRHEGLAPNELKAASDKVIELLIGALNDSRGQWLLSHPQASHEWRLSDEEGVEKIIDLAILEEEGWLVVDYKTSTRLEYESQEDFIVRLKTQYQEQLNHYVEYLQALDGRPARAAIYALDGCLWIELS